MLRFNALLLSLVTILSNVAVSAAPDAQRWAVWDANDPASETVIDHSPWQAVLDRRLSTSTDGSTQVDYVGFDSADKTLLNQYINSLTRIDPRGLHRGEQFAYWINLYNALTVQVVLKYPRKRSILRMGETFFSIGPWDDELVTIAGESISLNDIEHRILRPIWRDQRIHYAVNCASIGCPNLSAEVFTRENLERQLNAAEVNYINHPRGATFSKRGKLKVSSIFDWYQVDFGENEQALVQYLAKHHAMLGERIGSYDGNIGYDYDWKLNTPTDR